MFAIQLRSELALRNRLWARGRPHVESYGAEPVIVYSPYHPTDEDLSVGTPPHHPTDEDLSVGTPPDGERHGNFFDAAYAAILARPEWKRRLAKTHTNAARSLPRTDRPWRELDSSNSSDALLMNVFCTPGVVESSAVRNALGVEAGVMPQFGWKARVPLRNGLVDRTEVDMRLGSLLVEAKLTENDFQTRAARVVEGYRDFGDVFSAELLPRVTLRKQRRQAAAELAEEFTQEWESPTDPGAEATAREFQAGLVERAWAAARAEAGYLHYQLIRNVLAAYALECSFCVVHDERRPDLREAWFSVMAAVKHADLRVRLKVLTWQELAALLPTELQEFLDAKYGIS